MRLSAALTLAILPAAFAQASPQNLDPRAKEPLVTGSPTLTSRSTLVRVPALVRTKANKIVYSLSANDFTLTDDGIPQKLHLEEHTGSEPLALVVDIERGGLGARGLVKYTALASMLDSIVGGVPHEVAVVAFDSSPVVVREFTSDTDAAGHAIKAFVANKSGDGRAAILDSLVFSIDLLNNQPPEYRRAILLISETVDSGSHLKLDEALRSLNITNTTIYAVAFSSIKDYAKQEGPKTFGKGQIPWLSSKSPVPPGPANGCMSRDGNDPQVDLSKSAVKQAYDCLSLLAPPLRLAKIATVGVSDGLQKNVPETVSRLTGGEYFKLTDEASLGHSLQTISNHLPNRYILSFQPEAPHPGFHSLLLQVRGYDGLRVSARDGYWAEPENTGR
jgi:VWFA-related protein